MTAQSKNTRPESSAGSTATAALAHVGLTLESDPAYYGVLQKGKPTVEAQIIADFREEQSGAYEAEAAGQSESTDPEPLKTRLPGDTSSDPHTDLGPDSAAAIQDRDDVPDL